MIFASAVYSGLLLLCVFLEEKLQPQQESNDYSLYFYCKFLVLGVVISIEAW